MTDEFPQQDLETIKAAQQSLPFSTDPIRHAIEFAFGTRSLAEFTSTGPILTPVVGQRVSLHGVAVQVVEVDTAYEVWETDGGNRPAVFTTVRVVPAAADTEK